MTDSNETLQMEDKDKLLRMNLLLQKVWQKGFLEAKKI